MRLGGMARLLGDAKKASGIRRMALALHAKEQMTLPHSIRVMFVAEALGNKLGLGNGQLRALQVGGLLHDMGKISIPNGLLMKETALNEADWRLVRRHPEAGCRLLEGQGLEREVLEVIRHHHERYDGGGYPAGWKGKEIPRLARIIAVADSWDAMRSGRRYRGACSVEEARREIGLGAGRQYDPEVVEALGECAVEEWGCFKSGQKEMAGRNYRISYWY